MYLTGSSHFLITQSALCNLQGHTASMFPIGSSHLLVGQNTFCNHHCHMASMPLTASSHFAAIRLSSHLLVRLCCSSAAPCSYSNTGAQVLRVTLHAALGTAFAFLFLSFIRAGNIALCSALHCHHDVGLSGLPAASQTGLNYPAKWFRLLPH
ncbi:hypothetical protein XENTR_v10003206 [Xenopus tropicalis]|nr:hypothetical protein XENTR_v10018500 [Xenopus tropicalis]KAE8636936.1 hypothetical protein XENTR_v10003206 [Xenopus tropicalis]